MIRRLFFFYIISDCDSAFVCVLRNAFFIKKLLFFYCSLNGLFKNPKTFLNTGFFFDFPDVKFQFRLVVSNKYICFYTELFKFIRCLFLSVYGIRNFIFVFYTATISKKDNATDFNSFQADVFNSVISEILSVCYIVIS